MFRFIIVLGLVVLLVMQLGWVVITPKAYHDFGKIKSFFNEWVSSSEVEKVKDLKDFGEDLDITDLAKEEKLELYRKSGKKVVKTVEKDIRETKIAISDKLGEDGEEEVKGRVWHQIEDTGFWDGLKMVYYDFFGDK